MEGLYFDNASTSFPKAPGVAGAMRLFLEEVGASVGRGGYAAAYAAENTLLDAREALCALLGGPTPRNVVFCANVTAALNTLLQGLLQNGGHVLVSGMEHNAVMRPLVQMEGRGVTFSRIPCNAAGELDTAAMAGLVRDNTRAIVMLHASNVCGTLMPVEEVGRFAKAKGLFFILDAAQTAGVFDIDMARMGADAVAFTGHKGLLGPQGTGGFVLTDALAAEVPPLLAGGTGSVSDTERMPPFLPDKYEPGTPNLPGIYGLLAAVRYVQQVTPAALREKEVALARRLAEGFAALPGLRVVGSQNWVARAPVVSVDFAGLDNAEAAYNLAENHQIYTRCGMHCAPAAHKTLGTFPQGTVRFSPGHATTPAEVERCIEAVEQVVHALR